MLLVFAFAVLALGRAEVDIITSPSGPGNQYVRLQTGHQRDVRNLSEVQIKDEGLTGVQHKYPIKKAETTPEKKDFVGVKATVKDEGGVGVVKKESGNGVPALKHLPYEVLASKNNEEGGLDFDDDFHPLNKKKLVPAGTSQASRVNVKKGPNGQDYEYEYVYYYYDEDEDEPTTAKSKEPAVHESRNREEVVDEEPRRRNEARGDANRSRYTTIERGRATVTTTEQTNELVPRGGQRTRGRQFESSPIPAEEERLPANTRFPSRGRNGAHTTQAPQTEIPTRSRTTSGNVRRPSLVDSSSFRTHSSDSAPDAAQEQYYTNHRNSAEVPQNTRESDLEEYVDTIRPTTFSPPSTTTVRYHPIPPSPENEDNMPDKAAHDLYAILQQTQEENYVSPGEVEEATTEILTTPTTTTTTTTTTEATTTTTTTTQAPGRSRFRGVNGARARPRPSSYSTTQSPEPKEVTEEVKKSKFQPQRNRATSYRRSTTQAPQEESTTQKRNFGGNRYRSRGKQEEEKAESTTQAATPRPTRPRLNISGARPLRPGPKINLRRTSTQAPVSEETATVAVAQEEPVETTPATSPPPPPTPQDALSRLRNRPRLRVGARPHSAETTTTVQPPQEAEPSEESPSSTPEPAKPSPLLRRRPNIRRLTLPHSQPQPQQQR